jgi:hypothetical protein
MKYAKRIGAALLVLGVIFAAGIAYAAWTSSGTGSGSAKAATAQALGTVSADVTTIAAADKLYPGQTNGKAVIKITNPNPYPVRITGVSFDTGSYVSSDQAANCTDAPATAHPTGVTFNNQSALTLDVPANSAGTQFTLPAGSVSMDNTSDTLCQGTVFTIPVTLSGNSNA